jgi:hypothetical protein
MSPTDIPRTSPTRRRSCSAFFLLARKHPFVANTDGRSLAISEVLTRMEDASWPDWTRLPAGTPGGLRDLLHKMLAYEARLGPYRPPGDGDPDQGSAQR